MAIEKVLAGVAVGDFDSARDWYGQLLGRTLWDAFPGLEGSPFEPYYHEAMATGRPTAAPARERARRYFPGRGTC